MSRELIGCRLKKLVRVGWWNFKIKLMLKVWSTNKIAMDIKKKRSKNIEMSRELIGCTLMKLMRVDWSNFHIKQT